MIPFANTVYSLKFDDLPDYSHLCFMLTKCLLEKNMVPNKEFDWSTEKSIKFKQKLSKRQSLLLGNNAKIIKGVQQRRHEIN